MQMAVVVGEYGGKCGVVTLVDLAEEIVGVIAEELARMIVQSHHLRDGTWTVSGMLRPDEVREQTGLAVPESDEYDTVAGYVTQQLGRLAARGDVVEVELDSGADGAVHPVHVTITVERMEGRRIDRLSLTTRALDDEDGEER